MEDPVLSSSTASNGSGFSICSDVAEDFSPDFDSRYLNMPNETWPPRATIKPITFSGVGMYPQEKKPNRDCRTFLTCPATEVVSGDVT